MKRPTVKIYSQKARDIIEAFIGSDPIHKGPEGEILLSEQAKHELSKRITGVTGWYRSVRKMASSCMSVTMRNGKDLLYKDIFLLWMLIVNQMEVPGYLRHSMETIRKHYGEYAVDEMIGASTSNPLKHYRNKTLQMEMDKADEELSAKWDSIRTGMESLSKQIEAEYEPELEKLNMAIKQLEYKRHQMIAERDSRINEARRNADKEIAAVKMVCEAKKNGLKAKMAKGE